MCWNASTLAPAHLYSLNLGALGPPHRSVSGRSLLRLGFVHADGIGMLKHVHDGPAQSFRSRWNLESRRPRRVTRLRFYPPRNALGVATGSTPIPTMKRFVPDHTKRRPLNFCALTGMSPPTPTNRGTSCGGMPVGGGRGFSHRFYVHRNFGAGAGAIYFWCAGDHGIPSEAQRGTGALVQSLVWSRIMRLVIVVMLAGGLGGADLPSEKEMLAGKDRYPGRSRAS